MRRVAVAVFVLAAAGLVAWSRRHSGGQLVYALDDAYIHLAMARNLAEHGAFGVTRYGFSASSSAPLWTVLLAGLFALAGVRDWLPLVLNVAAGILLLSVADRVLRAHGVEPSARLAALLAIVFLTPLAPLVMTGQEHVLHAALTIAFAGLLSAAPSAGRQRGLMLLAPLLTAARYESLFLIAIGCVIFALRRRLRLALVVGVLALVPPVVYGLASVAHGWYPLPNPVILKGALADSHAGLRALGLVPLLGGWDALARTPHLLAPFLLAAIALVARWRAPSSPPGILLVLFLLTTLLHLQYAKTGWFYRYEAYLVALGIVALAAALSGLRGIARPAWLPPVLAGAALVACAVRGVRAHVETPGAAGNIYEQQIQMGRFLARFYPGQSVAANDIGAICYLADVRIFDLWGLATLEVAEAKLAHRYTTGWIAEQARVRGVRVAVIYERWLEAAGGVPPGWIRAGRWRVARNVVLGDRTVAFYAVDPAEAPALTERLRAFGPELPAGVEQLGPYTRGAVDAGDTRP